MATVTTEDALKELRARGVDPANPPPLPDGSGIDREAAIAELKKRGVEIPGGATPPLNSAFQPTPAQQTQHPIASMITKGLGTGMEAMSAPFQVAGEAIRGAGAGEPLKVATAQDPKGFRAPTILQRFMPNLRTPESPADPFQQAAMGLKGVATTAANLPQGVGPAIQAGAQAVQGPPGAAENIEGLGMALGSGEAGNIPFTAAIKPFTAIPELLKTGELAGIPGTGMLGKAFTEMDSLPMGLEHLTAHANPEVLEAATKHNVPATPGMVTGSPTLNAIESFGKKLPFSSNIFQKRFGEIYDAMKNIREPIVETSKPAADLGLDVQQGISGASNTAYANSKSLYENASKALPEGSQIPLNLVQKTASELSKSQTKLPAGAQSSGAGQLLKDLAGQGYEGKDIGRIMPEGEKVTGRAVPAFDYSTVQALRAELNNRIAQANTALKSASPGASFQSSPEAGIYSKLKDALDKDMGTFADSVGGTFKSAYSEATKTYQTYKQAYSQDKFVQSILNEQNPENVVNKIVSAAKSNPRALGMLKLTLPKETLDHLQTYFIKDMTEKVPNVFSPSHFAAQYDSIGEKRLTDILGPQKMAQLRPLYVLSSAGVNAESSGQAASGPSGAGMSSAMAIRGPIMAAITGASLGHPIKGLLAGAALGGAEMEGLPMMAKAYLSKPAGKFLTRQTNMSFPALDKLAPIAAKTAGPLNAIGQNPQSREALMQLLQKLRNAKQSKEQP